MPHMDTNVHALKIVKSIPRGIYIARHGCYVCNHNADLIIFPTVIETEGQLALCSRCIKRAAKLIGLEHIADLVDARDALASRVRELEALVADQGTIITSYEALLHAKSRHSSNVGQLPDDVALPGLEVVTPTE